MAAGSSQKTPLWLWGVGILFLIWNLFGVLNFMGTVTATPESYAAQGYTAEQITFMSGVPIYYLAIFALAVTLGVIGAIGFLMRKSWATKAFFLSLIFIVISLILDFTGGSFAALGSAYLGVMVFVTAMGTVQYVVSKVMVSKGHLR